jgi:hypothetical protein
MWPFLSFKFVFLLSSLYIHNISSFLCNVFQSLQSLYNTSLLSCWLKIGSYTLNWVLVLSITISALLGFEGKLVNSMGDVGRLSCRHKVYHFQEDVWSYVPASPLTALQRLRHDRVNSRFSSFLGNWTYAFLLSWVTQIFPQGSKNDSIEIYVLYKYCKVSDWEAWKQIRMLY